MYFDFISAMNYRTVIFFFFLIIKITDQVVAFFNNNLIVYITIIFEKANVSTRVVKIY